MKAQENTQNDYQMKQQVARFFEGAAKKTKYDTNMYDYYVDKVDWACRNIMKLNCFAAKVAETVEKTIGKFFTACKISDKQAWILACAVVENNLVSDVFGNLFEEEDNE